MRNLKQFLHTTWDVFRIYWEIAPFLTLGELITQIFISLQTLAYAYVFGIALDKIIDLFTKRSTDIAHLLPIIILFVFLDLIYSILGRSNSYFSGLLGNIDQGKIRLKETDILATLGISQLEDPEITNKTTRFNEVYSSMSQHLTQLMDLVSMLLTIISLGVVVFVFTPAVVVLFILFFGVKYFNNSRYIKKLWLLRRNTTEESRIAWSSIYSLGDPSSLKEISISGGAALLRNKFISYVLWFYKEYRRIRTRWLLFELSQSVLDTVFYGVGIYFLVRSGIEQAITIGTLTFYLRSLGSFSEQLNSFSYRFSRLIESSIRLQDALELFEVYKPEGDGKLSLPFSKIPPTISISDLTFQYPNGQSPVIKNLDLTVASGEKIAIVGENGAGKTTLVKLIAGIYIANQGEILINGKSLRQLNRKSWYKHLGVLFQDFNTYGSLSAIENIHIGKVSKKLKREAIWKALGKADATNFVKKYPRQLDQLLSERYKGGLRPSGGQWQKIAIARIFYRNAPVLILDEPTASIDAVSEAKIFDNVYKFMKGKTVIIISHRFSTVRNADRIIVLDKGRIIEQGSHEQLLKMDGKYAKAFKLQARGYK